MTDEKPTPVRRRSPIEQMERELLFPDDPFGQMVKQLETQAEGSSEELQSSSDEPVTHYRYLIASPGADMVGPIDATDALVASLDEARPGTDDETCVVLARHEDDGSVTILDHATGPDAVERMERRRMLFTNPNDAMDAAITLEDLRRMRAQIAPPPVPLSYHPSRAERLNSLRLFGEGVVALPRYRGLAHDCVVMDDLLGDVPTPVIECVSIGYQPSAVPTGTADLRDNRQHRRATAAFRRGKGKKP